MGRAERSLRLSSQPSPAPAALCPPRSVSDPADREIWAICGSAERTSRKKRKAVVHVRAELPYVRREHIWLFTTHKTGRGERKRGKPRHTHPASELLLRGAISRSGKGAHTTSLHERSQASCDRRSGASNHGAATSAFAFSHALAFAASSSSGSKPSPSPLSSHASALRYHRFASSLS